ncbi:hypothetical protein GOODEAATRI_005311 [Goodea atripinnis]|uniref:Uncharacterized protein n=1 Tax=Goodea atripinnis TaxID=208336 RepID=A0ABV0MFA0_9TELE
MGQGESQQLKGRAAPLTAAVHSLATSSASVPQGPGLGPIPMSQFGTISRQISRHNSSTTSSASMVSATGTYRRAPSVSSQQPQINGGPAFQQNSGPRTKHSFCIIVDICVDQVSVLNPVELVALQPHICLIRP